MTQGEVWITCITSAITATLTTLAAHRWFYKKEVILYLRNTVAVY